jgi:hypothetical protein
MKLDLSSLADVRTFAKQFEAAHTEYWRHDGQVGTVHIIVY